MSDNFFVSFNSPQCGWMSIGFTGGGREFHTTTAAAPHDYALPELLEILTHLLDSNASQNEFLLKWNRDPEEFDFVFKRQNGDTGIEIYQYPTENRDATKRAKVFEFTGNAKDIARAFHKTFSQMREDVDIDAFEQNWHQPFPEKEFRALESKLSA